MYILIIRYKQYNKQKVSSMSNWTSQNLKLFGQVLIKMSLKIGLKESVAWLKNYLHLNDGQNVCKRRDARDVEDIKCSCKKVDANLFSIVSHIVTKRLRRVERVLAWHGRLVLVVVVVGARRQAEHAFEGALEVGIAQRVEDGIERRVNVAQPDGGRVELGVDAVLAERHHHEQHEVRQPAQHKRTHDHA